MTPLLFKASQKRVKTKASGIDKGPYFDLSTLPAMRYTDAAVLVTELPNWQELHNNDPKILATLPRVVRKPSEYDHYASRSHQEDLFCK